MPMKINSTHIQIGFVAQEVETVYNSIKIMKDANPKP